MGKRGGSARESGAGRKAVASGAALGLVRRAAAAAERACAREGGAGQGRPGTVRRARGRAGGAARPGGAREQRGRRGRARGVGGRRERKEKRKRKWEKEKKERKRKRRGEGNGERGRAGFAPTRCGPGRPRATVACARRDSRRGLRLVGHACVARRGGWDNGCSGQRNDLGIWGLGF